MVLAGDIGGTNTTLALVERGSAGDFTVLASKRFSSQDLSGMEEAIAQALDEFSADHPQASLRGCCLSGAGPVVDNICHTSNIPWNIDGPAIQEKFGLPTIIINDFSAICYGIPLLDPADPAQLTPLPHPDGTMPAQSEMLPGLSVQAVVGAGTGLGIGYLVKEGQRYVAFPSEAGHSDFGAFDPETRELQAYLHEKIGANPGTEQYVSGQGIVNIHEFFCSRQSALNETNTAILGLPRDQRAPEISKASDSDPICGKSLQLFVQMYARFASSMALTYLPKGGLFLAGGIAAKNKQWFIKNSFFMETFLKNYKESMKAALYNIPVYIVEDYGISLSGAAHGFFSLNQ